MVAGITCSLKLSGKQNGNALFLIQPPSVRLVLIRFVAGQGSLSLLILGARRGDC